MFTGDSILTTIDLFPVGIRPKDEIESVRVEGLDQVKHKKISFPRHLLKEPNQPHILIQYIEQLEHCVHDMELFIPDCQYI